MRRRQSQSDGRDDSARARDVVLGGRVALLGDAQDCRRGLRLAAQYTYDEALAHFQLAEGIAPGFIRNRLMIAKCQLALRDKPNARKWAQLATELPIQNQYDDKKAVDEAKQMLASL